MSATRDKNQNIKFVYSNMYSLYRKGVERAREGASQSSDASQSSLAAEALQALAVTRPSGSGAVLKAGQGAPQVRSFTPAEMIGKRVARPAILPAATPKETPKASVSPVPSLKENLKTLEDLQARMRFLLQELEDLIKE